MEERYRQLVADGYDDEQAKEIAWIEDSSEETSMHITYQP